MSNEQKWQVKKIPLDEVPEAFYVPLNEYDSKEKIESEKYFLELAQQEKLYSEGAAFILYSERKVAGRLVAFTLPEETREGYIGFYNGGEGSEGAKCLLKQAQDYLKALQVNKIIAPVNINILFHYRFKINEKYRGASAYFTGEPKNPTFFPAHFRNMGYEENHWWSSWVLGGRQLLLWVIYLMYLWASTYLFRKKMAFKSKLVDLTRDRDSLKEIYQMIDQTFKDNYLYRPLGERLFSQLNGDKGPGKGHYFFLHYIKGEERALGFSYCYFSMDNRECVMHSFGLRDEYRHRGLAKLLILPVLKLILSLRPRKVVAALIKEGPSLFNRFGPAQMFYAMYEKKLN